MPLIGSCRIELYFSVPAVPYVARTPGVSPTLLRGKLGCLPPGPAALLPRTCPSNGIWNGRYGHGFYGNGYGNGYVYGYGNGNVSLETRFHSLNKGTEIWSFHMTGSASQEPAPESRQVGPQVGQSDTSCAGVIINLRAIVAQSVWPNAVL